MPIFYSPDVTKYPPNFLNQAIKDPNLEKLTGADFAISRLPIPPSRNLEAHIKDRTLFIQVKIGLDFDISRLHSAIARMQACKIPKGQAILLPIGDYYPDKNDGLLRVRGKKRFGTLSFQAYQTALDEWGLRGGIVEHPHIAPRSIEGLLEYVELKQRNISKIEREGKRGVYPPSPVFEPDDIWQLVEEINDWRSFLVSGLKNFGSVKANNTFRYMEKHFPNEKLGLYHVLDVLTAKKGGKQIYKIDAIGEKGCDEIRGQIGLQDGWNLGQLMYRVAFYAGWRAFGNDFVAAMKKKKRLSPKVINEILEKLMTEADKSIEENNCIPF